MSYTVKLKHVKTLRRRLNYLANLGEGANSYDVAEIAALRHAVEILESLDSLERALELQGVLVALHLLSLDQYRGEGEEENIIDVLREYVMEGSTHVESA